MRFTKLQGAGNDFILLEEAESGQDKTDLARKLCRHHFDIGADGLLILAPSTVADFAMFIFNPDGSEAEACGNGLRCIARYIVEKGYITSNRGQIKIETRSGVRDVILNRDKGRVESFSTSMGRPEFRAERIPVLISNPTPTNAMISRYKLRTQGKRLSLSFVSMGNPHAIHFASEPVESFPLQSIGPEVEKSAIFPHQTNFEVAHVLSPSQIEVRVWERGVGETLACGSGACAVAAAAQILGLADQNVDIMLPGGTLSVKWDRVGEVYLTGPAEVVFWGERPLRI